MLNGFDFDAVPAEIMTLNQYEKVLIQRAKVFQFVTKMFSVSSKRLPPSHRLSKVHGAAFHLPLPKTTPTTNRAYPKSCRTIYFSSKYTNSKECSVAGYGSYV